MAERAIVTLGAICSIVKGGTGIASAIPGDYPLVTTALERKTNATWQFDAEAICIPLVSSTGHGKKTLNRIHYQSGKFALGTILAAVIPHEPKKVSAAYIHRYLQFHKNAKLVSLMKGAANVSLAIRDIAKVTIELPSLVEQRKFVRLYDESERHAQHLYSEFESQEKILVLLRQSILQEAIEGKLTAAWRKKHPYKKGDPERDGVALLEQIREEKQRLVAEGKIRKEKMLAPIEAVEKPFKIPDGWVWCRLGLISNVVRGGSPRPAGDKRFYDGAIPFLKVADLTANGLIYLDTYTYSINEAGLHKTRFVDAGTIMLTNSGASLGVPKICTFATTFNDGIAAFLELDKRLVKEYLYYFLRSKSIWFLVEAARGQGQPNLNTEIIAKTVYSLPPLAEQSAIVERVEALLAHVDELEKEVASRKKLAGDLMREVLREAFEGGGAV